MHTEEYSPFITCIFTHIHIHTHMHVYKYTKGKAGERKTGG